MFNLDAMLQPYIERYGPALRSLGLIAEQHVSAIQFQLEDIQSSVRRIHENRRMFPGTLTTTAREIVTVPPGETWELEAFTISNLTAGVSATLTAGGSLRARSVSLFPSDRSAPIRIMGPVSIEGFATATTDAFIQFRVLAPVSRPTRYGGQDEAGLDTVDRLRHHDQHGHSPDLHHQ